MLNDKTYNYHQLSHQTYSGDRSLEPVAAAFFRGGYNTNKAIILVLIGLLKDCFS